jgi:hypothetical protein
MAAGGMVSLTGVNIFKPQIVYKAITRRKSVNFTYFSA